MRITSTGLLYDEPGRSTPGYLLIRTSEGDSSFLLDPDGKVVHSWTGRIGMTNWGYLLPNGHLFANERCANRKGVALTVSGRLAEYDKAGKLIWEHEDPYQHHDARRLDNGAIYAALTDLDDAEKAAIRGGVPGSESEGGPYGEVIRQVDDNGTVVWEWHFSRLDYDEHPLHRNANRWSYGHTNTVLPLGDGRILVSSKNLCLLFIVDHSTNEVVWRYQNDEMGGQHDAQLLENGNILIFANGAY